VTEKIEIEALQREDNTQGVSITSQLQPTDLAHYTVSSSWTKLVQSK